MDWSVGGASSASEKRRLLALRDGAQKGVSGAGPGLKRRRGEGGWRRIGTHLWSTDNFLVDDHVVRAPKKLTSGALRGLRRTVDTATLRAQGGDGVVAWACGSRRGTKELPRGQSARQYCRDAQTPRGQKCVRQPPWTAGRRAHEGADWPAAMSQRPRGLFHSFTGQSATPPISDVVAATSATQQQRPAFKTTTRRVEPLEKGS